VLFGGALFLYITAQCAGALSRAHSIGSLKNVVIRKVWFNTPPQICAANLFAPMRRGGSFIQQQGGFGFAGKLTITMLLRPAPPVLSRDFRGSGAGALRSVTLRQAVLWPRYQGR
jgi:hypothetical protein